MRLTRGDGGVRLQNADLARLMQILEPIYAMNTIVLTVRGDPPRLTSYLKIGGEETPGTA